MAYRHDGIRHNHSYNYRRRVNRTLTITGILSGAFLALTAAVIIGFLVHINAGGTPTLVNFTPPTRTTAICPPGFTYYPGVGCINPGGGNRTPPA